MDFQRVCCVIFFYAFLMTFLSNPGRVTAGDIVHDDDSAPKKPGCENDFVLVKVQTWVNGVEAEEFVGVGARFGPTIVSKEKYANQDLLSRSDPRDCCSTPKKKVPFIFANSLFGITTLKYPEVYPHYSNTC